MTPTFEILARRKIWRFATLAEASAAAGDIFDRSGVVVAVIASDQPATHVYEFGKVTS
jgi:hypothetical protein